MLHARNDSETMSVLLNSPRMQTTIHLAPVVGEPSSRIVQQHRLGGFSIGGPMQKKGSTFPCGYCGKSVHRIPAKIVPGRIYFCSRAHHLDHLRLNAHTATCVICGSEYKCQPCQHAMRGRKTCSKKCSRELFKNRRGPNAPGWKDGRSGHRAERYRYEVDDWRKSVLERDKHTCRICSRRDGKIETHHILPWALYKQHRTAIANGVTLCRPCHLKVSSGKRNNPTDLILTEKTIDEFLSKCRAHVEEGVQP